MELGRLSFIHLIILLTPSSSSSSPFFSLPFYFSSDEDDSHLSSLPEFGKDGRLLPTWSPNKEEEEGEEEKMALDSSIDLSPDLARAAPLPFLIVRSLLLFSPSHLLFVIFDNVGVRVTIGKRLWDRRRSERFLRRFPLPLSWSSPIRTTMYPSFFPSFFRNFFYI